MDKALNVIKGDAEFKGVAISVVGALIALLPYVVPAFGGTVPEHVPSQVDFSGRIILGLGVGGIGMQAFFALVHLVKISKEKKNVLAPIPHQEAKSDKQG